MQSNICLSIPPRVRYVSEDKRLGITHLTELKPDKMIDPVRTSTKRVQLLQRFRSLGERLQRHTVMHIAGSRYGPAGGHGWLHFLHFLLDPDIALKKIS